MKIVKNLNYSFKNICLSPYSNGSRIIKEIDPQTLSKSQQFSYTFGAVLLVVPIVNSIAAICFIKHERKHRLTFVKFNRYPSSPNIDPEIMREFNKINRKLSSLASDYFLIIRYAFKYHNWPLDFRPSTEQEKRIYKIMIDPQRCGTTSAAVQHLFGKKRKNRKHIDFQELEKRLIDKHSNIFNISLDSLQFTNGKETRKFPGHCMLIIKIAGKSHSVGYRLVQSYAGSYHLSEYLKNETAILNYDDLKKYTLDPLKAVITHQDSWDSHTWKQYSALCGIKHGRLLNFAPTTNDQRVPYDLYRA